MGSQIAISGTQAIDAICFHLVAEKWLPVIPTGLDTWLRKSIAKDRTILLNNAEWHDNLTGTFRLLWLMVAFNLDPFEICKWGATAADIAAMHRRFTNIIDSWGDALKASDKVI